MEKITSAQDSFARFYPRMRGYALAKIRGQCQCYNRDDIADMAMGHAWRHWLLAAREGTVPESYWPYIVRKGLHAAFVDLNGKTGFRKTKAAMKESLSERLERRLMGREGNPAVLGAYNVDLAAFRDTLTGREAAALSLRLEGHSWADVAFAMRSSIFTMRPIVEEIRAKWRAFRGEVADVAG